MIAVVLGSLTHVGLDEFTHPGRWGARNIPWLDQVHAGLAGTSWLQYGAGVIGLVGIVLWWSLVLARTAPQRLPVSSAAARRAVQLLVLLGAAAATADAVATAVTTESLNRTAFVGATRGVLLVAAGLTGGSVVWMSVPHRLRRTPG